MNLKQRIVENIQRGGPLSIADYMAQCNAHYYATRDPLGAKGDFITAPEISQIFGELIGLWCADAWMKMGNPPEVSLVELGPGRGTLMADALRATRAIPGFHDAISVQLIEISPVLRGMQEKALSGAHPRISWPESLEQGQGGPLLLIANEFFDALPVRQFVKKNDAFYERRITSDPDKPGKLRFVLSEKPHTGIGAERGGEGEIIELSPLSILEMERIARRIAQSGGAALCIDYGYEGPKAGDSFQAVSAHGYADPLKHPGEADLTAHVDFGALKQVAKGQGAKVHGPITQGKFLNTLGAGIRADKLCEGKSEAQQREIISALMRLVAPEQMGELFKVMAITSPGIAPEGFSA